MRIKGRGAANMEDRVEETSRVLSGVTAMEAGGLILVGAYRFLSRRGLRRPAQQLAVPG